MSYQHRSQCKAGYEIIRCRRCGRLMDDDSAGLIYCSEECCDEDHYEEEIDDDIPPGAPDQRL